MFSVKKKLQADQHTTKTKFCGFTERQRGQSIDNEEPYIPKTPEGHDLETGEGSKSRTEVLVVRTRRKSGSLYVTEQKGTDEVDTSRYVDPTGFGKGYESGRGTRGGTERKRGSSLVIL